MNVEVCYADAAGATRIAVVLDAAATVADALAASRIVDILGLDRAVLSFAIFGRRAASDALLHEGDRVELLRPLKVDPKEARHRRAAKKRGDAEARGGGGRDPGPTSDDGVHAGGPAETTDA